MNSKRSYLDTLNVGRQRKPHTTLEELNRTLENLESRFERARAPRSEPYTPDEDITRRMQRLSEAAAPVRARAEMPGSYRTERNAPERSFQGLVRDIERARAQEEGLAAVGKIAGELKDLREELRHQMTAGLRREFETIRADIERAYAAAASGVHGAELGQELERLSAAIRSLAERSDDEGVNLLRQEIEHVKGALDQLAREETVRSVGRRWDEFDRRWVAFEQDSKKPDPAIEALTARLEQIDAAVSGLPESLSLRSLEEKVRTLAGAIERFSRQQEQVSPAAFDAISERLDEISRAIVASSLAAPAPAFDPAPFERIEARITSLARQLDELAEEPPARELVEGLAALSHRVDEIAQRAEVPEQMVRKLAQQIAAISEKLDSVPAAPDVDTFLRGLDERFVALSSMLERRQSNAFEEGQALFRDLERRLEDLSVRLEQRKESTAAADTGIWDAIDARFAELTARLQQPANGEAIRNLEARLEDISSRLDQSVRQAPGIDPELIRNLEAQVAGLSEHLSRPGQPLPDFEDIGPRLDHIERSIAGSRDAILEAAHRAAEEAIRGFSGSKPDEAAVGALAEDLKSLEALARKSDERNTKTFEAIHDTLLKIVDRLGTLESRQAEETSGRSGVEPRGKMALDSAPSMEPDDSEMLPDSDADEDTARAPARSPAQAAAAAAMAALNEPAEKAGGRSMLGGLTRAFSARREQGQPVALAGDDPRSNLALAPDVEFDEPLDPKLANRPLEPGSGAPDLNAILRRVRDDRGQPGKTAEADTAAKADFIAAARRAAQAAAAEAEVLKKHADKGSASGKFSFGDMLRARRKMLLMAAGAIMLALAGLQLGKAFLADQPPAGVEPAPLVEQQPPEAAAPAPADEPAPDAAEQPQQTEETQPEPPSPRSEIGPEETPAVRMIGQTEDTPEVQQAASAPEMAAPAAASPVETATVAATDAEPMAENAPTEVAATAAPEPVTVGPAALREAAGAGDAKAMFEVASRYAEGRGTAEDLAAAARWYEKSAELGFAPAQYRIGNIYEKGLGVTRDIAKAKTWYEAAARQGNVSAMHNLAVLFAMGADGAVDNEVATRWFLEAAEHGVKDSQFNLGVLAAKGVGMPQNLEESYRWFELVAKTGDKDAAAKRDEVAKTLSPQQLEKARAAAEIWKSRPVDPEANGVEIPESWKEDEGSTAGIDMKQAVRNIQLILNKNGYDAGGADGVMGQRTKAAIAAFQKDNGMAATGEVDRELVQALLKKK